MFGPLDSKGKADAHAAKVVRALNDPGLLQHHMSKAYKKAAQRRSDVLARVRRLGRVSDGGVHVDKNGKYIGQLTFNGKQVWTLTHAERGGPEKELASLRSTLLRGGTVEDHRLLHKAERVRLFHAKGTAARKEMMTLLQQEREGTNGNTRVSLTQDGHVPVREKWNGKKWYPLCSTPNCMKFRASSNTKSDKCHACGGGHRCRGPNGKGCPFHMTVTTNKNRCDGMCVACFVEENFGSDDPKIRERLDELEKRHRAKETAVQKVLKDAFPDWKIIFDRTVKDDEDRKSHKTRWWVERPERPNLDRPDVRFVGGARAILVEVDENSHVTYVCSKEREREARVVNLLVTGRKDASVEAALVRFNPDAYTDCAGKRVGSCFGRSKKAMLTTITNEREWKRRTRELVETIRTLQIPKGEPDHFALPPPELDPRKPFPNPEKTAKDARCVWTVELFYDHVVDPTAKAVMCRSGVVTATRVRPADESAGGSSSLSKRGAGMLTGFKRAAKAKKAKAANRTNKAARARLVVLSTDEDESDESDESDHRQRLVVLSTDDEET